MYGGWVMSRSDEVIQFVQRSYIEPAAKDGEKVIKIRAGDVHKALRWSNRVPSVCQALTSKRFLDQSKLVLVDKQGPPSGVSTTTIFTYRLNAPKNPPLDPAGDRLSKERSTGLLSLRGAGKELFARLGGAEVFIQEERRRWNTTTGPLPRRKG
jgi:hypothetical protein